ARGGAAKQALEELYSRSDDEGRIPVLASQAATALRFPDHIATLRRLRHRAMMLDHRRILTQDLAELTRRLLDDAGIRDRIDHSLKAMLGRVLQGEGERGTGLATAGGGGQPEHTLGLRCRLDAGGEDLSPRLVHWRIGRA